MARQIQGRRTLQGSTKLVQHRTPTTPTATPTTTVTVQPRAQTTITSDPTQIRLKEIDKKIRKIRRLEEKYPKKAERLQHHFMKLKAEQKALQNKWSEAIKYSQKLALKNDRLFQEIKKLEPEKAKAYAAGEQVNIDPTMYGAPIESSRMVKKSLGDTSVYIPLEDAKRTITGVKHPTLLDINYYKGKQNDLSTIRTTSQQPRTIASTTSSNDSTFLKGLKQSAQEIGRTALTPLYVGNITKENKPLFNTRLHKAIHNWLYTSNAKERRERYQQSATLYGTLALLPALPAAVQKGFIWNWRSEIGHDVLNAKNPFEIGKQIPNIILAFGSYPIKRISKLPNKVRMIRIQNKINKRIKNGLITPENIHTELAKISKELSTKIQVRPIERFEGFEHTLQGKPTIRRGKIRFYLGKKRFVNLRDINEAPIGILKAKRTNIIQKSRHSKKKSQLAETTSTKERITNEFWLENLMRQLQRNKQRINLDTLKRTKVKRGKKVITISEKQIIPSKYSSGLLSSKKISGKIYRRAIKEGEFKSNLPANLKRKVYTYKDKSFPNRNKLKFSTKRIPDYSVRYYKNPFGKGMRIHTFSNYKPDFVDIWKPKPKTYTAEQIKYLKSFYKTNKALRVIKKKTPIQPKATTKQTSPSSSGGSTQQVYVLRKVKVKSKSLSKQKTKTKGKKSSTKQKSKSKTKKGFTQTPQKTSYKTSTSLKKGHKQSNQKIVNTAKSTAFKRKVDLYNYHKYPQKTISAIALKRDTKRAFLFKQQQALANALAYQQIPKQQKKPAALLGRARRTKGKLPSPTKDPEKFAKAYQPQLKYNKNPTIMGAKYKSFTEALHTGMKLTDNTRANNFIIKQVPAKKGEIKRGRITKIKHKFIKKGNSIYERRKYRRDKPNEIMKLIKPKNIQL